MVLCAGQGFKGDNGAFLSEGEFATLDAEDLPEGLYFCQGCIITFVEVGTRALYLRPPTPWNQSLVELPERVSSDGGRRFWQRKKEEIGVDSTDAEQEAAAPTTAASSGPRRKVRMRTLGEETDDEDDDEGYDPGGDAAGISNPELQRLLGRAAAAYMGGQTGTANLRANQQNENQSGLPSVSRRRLFGAGASGGSSGPGGEAAGTGNAQTEVQLMMLSVLERLSERLSNEGAGELEGLKSLKALDKLRRLKEAMKRDPARILREFKEYWEEELNAAGKPWSRMDVCGRIDWQKFLSEKRAFQMQGEVLRCLKAKQYDLAAAQRVRNMKALQQFASAGDWLVARSLTHLVDTISRRKHICREEELEAVLSHLKVQKEIENAIRTRGPARNDAENPEKGNGDSPAPKNQPHRRKEQGGGGQGTSDG